MTNAYESFGRMNQKMRTREAIQAAAAEFVQRGESPNMTQIAEAARVSKSTAYRYFPSLDALLAEALLEITIKPDLESVYAVAQTAGTPAARLDAVVRADHALVIKHEHAFRTAIRVMLTSASEDMSETPRRPGNRLRYLAQALAPLQEQFGSERMERLVMALALCVGMESIVVMKDICGLTSAEAEAVKLWATGALLHFAVQESEADPGR
jgi:AcrR family transcriptional regulator